MFETPSGSRPVSPSASRSGSVKAVPRFSSGIDSTDRPRSRTRATTPSAVMTSSYGRSDITSPTLGARGYVFSPMRSAASVPEHGGRHTGPLGRENNVMSAFAELKAGQAVVWGSAPWERMSDDAADIYEDLIARLGVTPGATWLDLATGTGAIALRAAERGAVVTGQDLAPGLIETARKLAAEKGLDVAFDVGDCEELPYPDASFDVVSSAQGVVVAPDHRAVAGQLARAGAVVGREDHAL